ncbi:hypothetical protein [Streptomyces clavifer]|uniref:hypothetical protein n=1 Tax=Streptomyces clavifer TaxID=68188 RepID=UPI0033F68D90
MMAFMQGWKKTALIVTSCVLIIAMVSVWMWVDLGAADGTASVIGASAGLIGLTYALISGNSSQQTSPSLTVANTGKASAVSGSTANTGITLSATGGFAHVSAEETGDADSDGTGDANTGIRLS